MAKETQNQQEKGFKRQFPKINTCFPFCCTSFETGIKIATIILIILSITGSIPFGTIYALLSSIPIIIILILLCVGIFKKKVSYFKAFEIVFGIILLLGGIFGIFRLVLEVMFIFGNHVVGNTEQKTILSAISNIVITIIYFCVFVYYYMAVLSYKEDIEEELYKVNQQKALEENVQKA